MIADPKAATPPAGSQRFVVARADEIPEGERLIVDVDGRKVGVFNVAGEYHAILHLCPHAGGPLCEGQLVEDVFAERPGEIDHNPDRQFIACPWHGWTFDIKTGQSWADPSRLRARRFPVDRESGAAITQQLEPDADPGTRLVPGPYVVDRFPVVVEDEYIVVVMRARPNPPLQAKPSTR
jgi:nitrite reductase/ring-hydroxylating ferredoxin subunit